MRAKWQPMAVAGAITAGLIFALWWWPRDQGREFATPADCLETLREAGREGSLPGYLDCLEKNLRATKERLTTAGKLRDQIGPSRAGPR